MKKIKFFALGAILGCMGASSPIVNADYYGNFRLCEEAEDYGSSYAWDDYKERTTDSTPWPKMDSITYALYQAKDSVTNFFRDRDNRVAFFSILIPALFITAVIFSEKSCPKGKVQNMSHPPYGVGERSIGGWGSPGENDLADQGVITLQNTQKDIWDQSKEIELCKNEIKKNKLKIKNKVTSLENKVNILEMKLCALEMGINKKNMSETERTKESCDNEKYQSLCFDNLYREGMEKIESEKKSKIENAQKNQEEGKEIISKKAVTQESAYS